MSFARSGGASPTESMPSSRPDLESPSSILALATHPEHPKCRLNLHASVEAPRKRRPRKLQSCLSSWNDAVQTPATRTTATSACRLLRRWLRCYSRGGLFLECVPRSVYLSALVKCAVRSWDTCPSRGFGAWGWQLQRQGPRCKTPWCAGGTREGCSGTSRGYACPEVGGERRG